MPMHINYNWSVHWKWIETIFKDKWSKLIDFFPISIEIFFYEVLQHSDDVINSIIKYKKYFQFFCLHKDK